MLPNKPNILYEVIEKKRTAEEILIEPLAKEIKEKGVSMDRVLIFCNNYTDVTTM